MPVHAYEWNAAVVAAAAVEATGTARNEPCAGTVFALSKLCHFGHVFLISKNMSFGSTWPIGYENESSPVRAAWVLVVRGMHLFC